MEDHSFDISVHGSGYNIAVMVVSGIVFGISISNAVYFSRMSDKPSEAVSKSTANIMMVMNILISILLGAIFVWSSYKLVISEESKYHTMSKHIHRAKRDIHDMRHKTQQSLAFLDNIDTHHDSYHHNSYHHDFMSDADFSDF
jgi:ABC-type nickel/cobalt efflux system permease component RcnA